MIPIQKGYTPGAIGRVAELHSRYYAKHWNFGAVFEVKVATELADFMSGYDATRDGFWFVEIDGRLEGTITIDGNHAADEGAHLRWFILSDRLRGQGVGRRLLSKAVSFCLEKNYPQIYLWTFAGLHAARSLYEEVGFTLAHEQAGQQWGTEVTEQKFILRLENQL